MLTSLWWKYLLFTLLTNSYNGWRSDLVSILTCTRLLYPYAFGFNDSRYIFLLLFFDLNQVPLICFPRILEYITWWQCNIIYISYLVWLSNWRVLASPLVVSWSSIELIFKTPLPTSYMFFTFFSYPSLLRSSRR